MRSKPCSSDIVVARLFRPAGADHQEPYESHESVDALRGNA